MGALLVGLTALLAVATLLPLSRAEAWWVRGWDFPRLQLCGLALVLLPTLAVLGDRPDPGTWVMLAVLAGCAAYQGWWIFPYTRLHRTEVAEARDGDPDRRIRILASNVLTPNRKVEALLATVRARRPDVLIAVETDRRWEAALDGLEPEYGHSLKCPLDNLYGMHVYSRLPLEDARIQFLVEPDVPSMHAVVVLRSGERVRLHCLHPTPPAPQENPESTERDAELVMVGRSVAEAELPVIVAGDLNDVAWSETTRLFRKVSGLLDPRVGRGTFNTFHARYPVFRWPLDHLFHSRHFRLVHIERLPAIGSDHFPILVELELTGDPAANPPGPRPDAEDERRAEEKMRAEGVDETQVHEPGERRPLPAPSPTPDPPTPMRRTAALLLAALAAAPLHAQAPPAERADPVLQAEIERLARDFRGEVGVYVRHLRTGASASLLPDETFPTASLIKVPLLLALYDRVERGLLDPDAELPYPDTLDYRFLEPTDVVGYMEPGETLPLSELAFLMLSVSDNVASLWIQALVGGGGAVNEWLAAHGFRATRVNSRTPGREAERAEYGWGQTTPREIAGALVEIREGRAVSPAASEAMYRLLTASYWRDVALSQIPPTVQAASKQGFVARSRSEVLLVNAPGGDYVLAVVTKDQEDTGYGPENEGYALIRAVSRAVYRHFEPADPWRPAR